MSEDLSPNVQQAQAVATHLILALLPDDAHDDLEINASESGENIRLEVSVPEKHRGALIGRGGYVAKQMRYLLSLTQQEGDTQAITLDIVDDRED